MKPLAALPKDRAARVGRYQLGEELARTATWTLHASRDGLGPSAKPVLVKVFADELARDPIKRRDLAGIARTLRPVVHEGLVKVLDIVEQPQALAIVLEPLEGVSLQTAADAARARGLPVPIAVAVRIALEALSALEQLHALLGDTERPSDLSQASIFLTKQGVTKIIDFELEPAKTALAVARRAPERQGGRPGDRRSDLYAVGVMLWELLVGRPLFDPPEGADGATYARTVPIGRVDQAGLRKTDPCPPALSFVVAKALAKSPTGRFETTAEMGEELLASVGGALADAAGIAAFVQEISASDAPAEGDRITVRPPEPAPPKAPAGPEGRPAGKLAMKTLGPPLKAPEPTAASSTATTPKAPVATTTQRMATPAADDEVEVPIEAIASEPPKVAPPPPAGAGKTQRMEIHAAPPPPPVAPAPTPKPAAASGTTQRMEIHAAPPPPPVAPAPTPTPAPAAGKTQRMEIHASPTPPPLVTPTPPVPVTFTPTPPITQAPTPSVPITFTPTPADVAPPPAAPPAPLAAALATPSLGAMDDVPRRAPKQPLVRWVVTGVGAVTAMFVVFLAATKPRSPDGGTPPPTSTPQRVADERPPSTATARPTAAPPTTTSDPPRADPIDDTRRDPGDVGGPGGKTPLPGDPGRPPGDAPPKTTASEEKAPPPPPLRRKYNPKTI